ncbi:hypothetical protein RHMOL_Rhmol12G0014000 [Rhododendron molle]|uniref:Uncharacterized protein n=1 Tax=Rhododendron molle TaxID=49168 RepID=A0ACC0LED0_RHOML|nr:hypothetical protein RHMOL_Rhmol12G0014000 [Rhododendron molle]
MYSTSLFNAGKISVSELWSIFKALIFDAVAGMSSADLTDAVSKIDKDGDGAIELQCFTAFHCRERNPQPIFEENRIHPATFAFRTIFISEKQSNALLPRLQTHAVSAYVSHTNASTPTSTDVSLASLPFHTDTLLSFHLLKAKVPIPVFDSRSRFHIGNCSPHLQLQMDASERYHYNPTLKWNPRVEEYFIKAYGADHFTRISKALTSPSCYSCIRVNTLQSTSDAIIEKLSSALTGIRQQSGTDGTNQSDTHAEYLIGPDHKESHIPPTSYDLKKAYLAVSGSAQNYHVSKCQLPGLDYVVFVKGSGPHTVNYGYAQDKPPKEVIVSRKCAEAVLRGAQVYVPGVLGCSAHVEKGDVVAVSVAVEQPGQDGGWVVDPYFLERKGLYIGQGTTIMSRAGMFRVLKGTAVDVNDRVFKLPSFHDVLEGEIFLQNLPSIVTAHVLEPQQGEKILDMCAAPGGKTTAIAILMKDKGEVVAVDRSHNKVLDIQKLAAEMGLNCITTYKLDALKAVRQRSESNDMHTSSFVAQEGSDKDSTGNANFNNEQATQTTKACNAVLQKSIQGHINGRGRSHCLGGRVEKAEGFYPNSFDRVLLDAPCSALGLRPRLFAGEETIEGLRNHAKYQRKMFDQAVQLVRPGGVITQRERENEDEEERSRSKQRRRRTKMNEEENDEDQNDRRCTINPGENEALVRYALDSYKFLSLALQNMALIGASKDDREGVEERWNGFGTNVLFVDGSFSSSLSKASLILVPVKVFMAEKHPNVGGPGLLGGCQLSDGSIEEWLRPGEEDLVQRFDPSSPLDTIGFFIAKFNVGPKDD